jgi:hypothetical protein
MATCVYRLCKANKSSSAKGLYCTPNCTGDEIAFHLALRVARELYGDDGMETLTDEDEEFRNLPETSTDEVEDEDVSCDSILHPSIWFKPFNRSDCQNHLPVVDEVE